MNPLFSQTEFLLESNGLPNSPSENCGCEARDPGERFSVRCVQIVTASDRLLFAQRKSRKQTLPTLEMLQVKFCLKDKRKEGNRIKRQ